MPVRIIGDTKIDFIGKRRIAFVVSALLVLLGIFAAVMVAGGKGNLGIQFLGGTQVEGFFADPVAISDLRSALATGGFPDAEIVELRGRGQPNFFLVRLKSETAGDAQAAEAVLGVIQQFFPDNTFTMDSVHEVGPAVGESLKRDALRAIVISLFGILLYIAVRFDIRFGFAATLATFHDVLVVLGFAYLMRMEISILVVSALLTIAGYSLTDTVVVYDRIRENLRKYHRKGDFMPAVNRSINEVLSRTIMTSVTTGIVVLVLYLVGGPVLRDFATVLLMGIVVGTYSSWFVASPVYIEWENRRPKRFRA
ncbi:MAG TPA: protein translocase subunit SecF [Acidobacteriota bacterium]|nr:protein translocase subunit SecF [Acidobacteriota bacterium]